MIKAGLYADGILDYWQIHTYPSHQNWVPGAPWIGYTAEDYAMDAPLVLGEYPGEVYEWNNVGEPLPGDLSTAEMVFIPFSIASFILSSSFSL